MNTVSTDLVLQLRDSQKNQPARVEKPLEDRIAARRQGFIDRAANIKPLVLPENI